MKQRILILLTLFCFGFSISISAQNEMEYPNAHLVVDVDWLTENHANANLRLIDMRSDDAYAEAHIPDAVHVAVDDISSSVNNIAMEFDQEEVQQVLNQIGLTPDMTVVIYDNLGMMNSARMFWTLEYVGHKDVRILNGGWNAWIAADMETSSDVPQFEASDYPIELQAQKIISAMEIQHRLHDGGMLFVDARSLEEYTGEVRFAERGGHIPGAVHFTWLNAISEGEAVPTIESDWVEQLQDDEVEVFRPAAEIQSMLDALNITSDKTIIPYCQTFWRGAHVYFVLRLMGFEKAMAYDGSWSEWGNNSDLPIVMESNPNDE